ncbi:MAG: hypothetical protein IK997_01800 [Bacilli bacterium]|nr:hypothetical protein [Bacilli bacterium]
MKDLVYYSELYDLYKNLLTDKQREYFEEYYFNDLSLSEISSDFDISRNAVSKQLAVIREKLDEFELKLKLYSKKENILKCIDDEKLKDKVIDILLS